MIDERANASETPKPQERANNMPHPNYIQQAWDQFAGAVIPDEAPETQRKEMRGAFFAGVCCLMTLLLNQLDDTGDPNEVTEADLKVMDDVRAELVAYTRPQ